jgi:peptide-methionine (S)-S-oxide reductase
MKIQTFTGIVIAGLVATSLLTREGFMETEEPKAPKPIPEQTETATFAAGCFWCTEAVLEGLDGVVSATSGYIGGQTENPSYKEICTGQSGHAEATQVVFDPTVIKYETLLDMFWRMHDPTTLNRQGADVGTQYRSGIFYHSEEQRLAAEASKSALDQSGTWKNPVVTEITAATTFYPAETEHQDLYRSNKNYGYCRMVITPKMKKLGLE